VISALLRCVRNGKVTLRYEPDDTETSGRRWTPSARGDFYFALGGWDQQGVHSGVGRVLVLKAADVPSGLYVFAVPAASGVKPGPAVIVSTAAPLLQLRVCRPTHGPHQPREIGVHARLTLPSFAWRQCRTFT